MATYCDLTSAKVQLSLSDAVSGDAADIAYLSEIDIEISRTFELKTGRKWGDSATATARTIDGPIGTSADILLLPVPLRSVTAIAIIGEAPETLTAYNPATKLGDWQLWHVTREGDAHAIRRVQNGYWPLRDGRNRVTVTGVWSDESSGVAAPQEIVDAVTFVTVETFRQRKSSPTGEIGADGFMFRPRNPWNFENVKEAILKYKAAKPIVCF